MKLVEYLRQEWCNPKNIDLKGSGYITKGVPDGLMVLCIVEKLTSVDEKGVTVSSGLRYRPLRYNDLNLADAEL